MVCFFREVYEPRYIHPVFLDESGEPGPDSLDDASDRPFVFPASERDGGLEGLDLFGSLEISVGIAFLEVFETLDLAAEVHDFGWERVGVTALGAGRGPPKVFEGDRE